MARKVEVDFKVIIGIIALVIIATAGSAYSTYLIFQRGNTGMEATEAANVQKQTSALFSKRGIYRTS